MEKLIINRKTWCRGEGTGHLFNGETSCCLGFYARKVGIRNNQLFDLSSAFWIGRPNEVCKLSAETNGELSPEVAKTRAEKLKGLVTRVGGTYKNTRVCRQLMITNDDEDISDEVREGKIKELFKKINVNVVFIGEKRSNDEEV